MSGRVAALLALALTGAMGFTTPAWPQDAAVPCRLCDSQSVIVADRPSTPVRLDVEASLDFDRLIIAGQGEGRAELGPDGTSNVSGSVASIGARTVVGEVVIRGEPGRYVRVDLPARIELRSFGGGTVSLESLRSDLPAMPQLDGNGSLRFRFGGMVRIQGDADGEFRGDVPIEVEYY